MRGTSLAAGVWLACVLLLPSRDLAAQDTATTATGSSGVIEGAPWRIDIPAHWNGDLVVQMHGYETVGVPRPDVSAPGEDARVFLADGYAVAASSYATQGWAIEDGVADSDRLRQHFIATHGEPGRTLAVGYSMGGHVALATLETYGEHYDGALSLCGVNAPAAEVFADGNPSHLQDPAEVRLYQRADAIAGQRFWQDARACTDATLPAKADRPGACADAQSFCIHRQVSQNQPY